MKQRIFFSQNVFRSSNYYALTSRRETRKWCGRFRLENSRKFHLFMVISRRITVLNRQQMMCQRRANNRPTSATLAHRWRLVQMERGVADCYLTINRLWPELRPVSREGFWPNAGLTLAQRRRQWNNIQSTWVDVSCLPGSQSSGVF